ncbi:nicotinate-nucleotide adenylyltransferase, partial [Dioszegia hungarica]
LRSPPFAGTASEQPDPEPLSLDSSIHALHAAPEAAVPHPAPGGQPLTGTRQTADSIPGPSRPNGIASQHASSESEGGGPERRAGHERILTAEDEHLSKSRSKRLLSGYLFGDPHKDVAIPISRNPTPPLSSHGLDSPPLTEADESELQPSLGQTADAVDAEAGEDDIREAGLGRDDGLVKGHAGPSARRNTQTRDRESGWDALNGLNDGEADLDESAPQGEGGTEDYLSGMKDYVFPRHRLRTSMKDETKIPIVIVACGSFSPPTYLHLRMFEMAKDEVVESQTYEIMGGYYSPVSSKYKKSGLAPAIHRVRMCELAVEHTSTWLMVDPWEAGQAEYQRTAVVLEHFDELLNSADGVMGGGLVMSDGKRRRIKVMLLAGGDLIESFGEPGVWSEPDLHIILGRFGCLIVERAGSDVWAFLLSHDILYHHRRNVIVIKQLIYNDISSTKVRLFVRRGMSIKYLLPNSVIQYIYDNKLYRGSDAKTIAP